MRHAISCTSKWLHSTMKPRSFVSELEGTREIRLVETLAVDQGHEDV